MSSKPSGALIENLLTCLCHDPKNGRIVANLVNPELFEGDYREFAEKAVEYWRRFDQPPGAHMSDLVADVLEDKDNRRAPTFRRIIVSMIELSETINTGYVLEELRKFTRLQKLKDAITKSAEKITSQQEMAIDDVEAMWHDILKVSEQQFDLGTSLTDVVKITEGLGEDDIQEFATGIYELDRRGIVPRRGEATLFLAPKGRGKSWACIHVAKTNLQKRKKVVHVSLEMDEIQLGRRYYQSLFSATKRDAVVKVPILRKDRGEVTAIEHEDVEAEFTFRSKILHDEIMNHSEPLGRRFENLRIKRFPTRGLTVRQLDGYLDMLEQVDGFIPDLLILDYIGIMKTDARDLRISLSTTFEDLRGLLVRRNLAGFIPQQTTRASVNARIVKPTDIAEAFALVHTADQAITMSQTEFEKKLGVARLFVGHARDEMDEFGCIITQHYGLGQFCLDSAPLHSSFFELIDDMKKDGAGDDDEDGYDNRNDNND
jgi:KaiC/GvpD/RAD55 family RecA-like ATPase